MTVHKHTSHIVKCVRGRVKKKHRNNRSELLEDLTKIHFKCDVIFLLAASQYSNAAIIKFLQIEPFIADQSTDRPFLLAIMIALCDAHFGMAHKSKEKNAEIYHAVMKKGAPECCERGEFIFINLRSAKLKFTSMNFMIVQILLLRHLLFIHSLLVLFPKVGVKNNSKCGTEDSEEDSSMHKNR